MSMSQAHERRSPKTSIDILRERDELDARLQAVNGVLASIEDETEQALRHPQIALLALCRVAALVRRLRYPEPVPAPESDVRQQTK